jgi:membrane-associated phospholipid phosphatase
VKPGQRRACGSRFRPVYNYALLLPTLAFACLGLLAHSGRTLLSIDIPITERIQGVDAPPYGWFLAHVSDLGFPPGNVIAFVVVIVALVAARLPLEAVLAAVSSLAASGVGGLVKEWVGRPRPSGTGIHVVGHISGFSFPSGHVTQYTTLFGFCFFVVYVTWQRGWIRAWCLVVLGTLVVAVGPSRVYLGQHWPSDVLGAYLLAGAWLAGTIELYLVLKPRFWKLYIP